MFINFLYIWTYIHVYDVRSSYFCWCVLFVLVTPCGQFCTLNPSPHQSIDQSMLHVHPTRSLCRFALFTHAKLEHTSINVHYLFIIFSVFIMYLSFVIICFASDVSSRYLYILVLLCKHFAFITSFCSKHVVRYNNLHDNYTDMLFLKLFSCCLPLFLFDTCAIKMFACFRLVLYFSVQFHLSF